eukprot:GEMP01087254.1.p2 GENE.GEMP01087254.1~~GEMP01087254.1.p2  ORF type:complete len:108 (+),score=22.52 GEMP01087254.1:309-632(+)
MGSHSQFLAGKRNCTSARQGSSHRILFSDQQPYSLSFGCVGLCTAVRPWQTLYLFGLMPVPLLVAVGASILGEMLMMDEDTAHAGHWAGFSLGMVYGLFVRKRWKGR